MHPFSYGRFFQDLPWRTGFSPQNVCQILSFLMASSYHARDVNVHKRVEVINRCLPLALGVQAEKGPLVEGKAHVYDGALPWLGVCVCCEIKTSLL